MEFNDTNQVRLTAESEFLALRVESSVLNKILMTGLAALALLNGPLISSALAADDPIKAATDAAAAAQVSGDTGFMLISAALVLLMTPGLAFFYGGFVRTRNVLNTMMMSFILMGIVGTSWILWGYSLRICTRNAVLSAACSGCS